MSANPAPRVSVIIPTYRRPELLVEAVGSVVGGTYTDLELLVLNDGPEEDLALARSRFPDPRIQWITRSRRLGFLANHLDGFRRARGEFVANLDDDDRWDEHLLERLVPILEHDPDLSVAFADHFVVDASGDVDEQRSIANSRRWGRAALAPGAHRPFIELALVDRAIAIQCAAVFRLRWLDLDDYDERIGSCWDLWTTYQLARGGAGAWYEPQRLAFYREHAGGISASGRETTARSAIYCWERWLADPSLARYRSRLARPLFAAHLRLAYELAGSGRPVEALRHTGRAAQLAPWLARGLAHGEAKLGR